MTPPPIDAAWWPWLLWPIVEVVLVVAAGQALKHLARSVGAWARWRWAWRAPSLLLAVLGVGLGGPILLSAGLVSSVMMAGYLAAGVGAASPLIYDLAVWALRRRVKGEPADDTSDGTR